MRKCQGSRLITEVALLAQLTRSKLFSSKLPLVLAVPASAVHALELAHALQSCPALQVAKLSSFFDTARECTRLLLPWVGGHSQHSLWFETSCRTSAGYFSASQIAIFGFTRNNWQHTSDFHRGLNTDLAMFSLLSSRASRKEMGETKEGTLLLRPEYQ